MSTDLELYVQNIIAIRQTIFKYNNPQMISLTLVKLRNDMKSAIDKALEEAFKKGEDEKMTDVINRAASEVVTTYNEKRRMLAINYAFKPVTEMIAQHFLYEDEKETEVTDEVAACETCLENMFFLPFPPKNFINGMVESILFKLDDPDCDTPEKRMLAAKKAAHFMMHEWLAADPETRL
jgi:hypothetical protein